MIITTPSPTRKPAAPRASRRRGFTLVEIMIGATLSSFVLAAVLSTFLFMGRSGANLANYSDMESQARKALEIFAQDVRQASAIAWTSSTRVRLTVRGNIIIYYYDDTTHADKNRFIRRVDASGAETTLITKITEGTFAFKAYTVAGNPLLLDTAARLSEASSSTKQLQISLEAHRATTTVVRATNLVLSARFILRNKIVTA